MKRKKLDPLSQEAVDLAVEKIRKMTPQERYDFLFYRTPGIEETDMTGQLGLYSETLETPCVAPAPTKS